jgi:queuosine precursor transporter
MLLDAKHRLFIGLAATFCTCLVVGDLIGGKLVSGELFGFRFTTTVGMVPFPVTFLLTDVLNEFYGKRAARFVTFTGFFMAALTFAIVFLAASIPIADLTRDPEWTGVTDASFRNVFLGSLRMLVASLAAYLCAQLVDITVFSALRSFSEGKLLWLRATGSTAVSQIIDTIAITLIAWSGTIDGREMVRIMISAYTLKLAIAVMLTPLVYALHAFIEKRLGIRPFVPALGP